MRFLYAIILFVAALCIGVSHAEKVRVIADDVNIRASSNTTSKVLGQVSTDAILETVCTNGPWTAVHPPPEVSLWIHADLVSQGKVRVKQANLRAGPGINYSIMGRLHRGDPVSSSGQFSNWLKILPPEGTIVWISSDLIEPLAKALPSKQGATNSAAVGVAAKPPKPLALTGDDEAPSADAREQAPSLSAVGITTNMLVKTVDQGLEVTHKGILKKASVVWRRPSRYMLVANAEGETDEPICYVTGNDPQLESVLGKKMTVTGRQFIVQGVRIPVVSATRIVLH